MLSSNSCKLSNFWITEYARDCMLSCFRKYVLEGKTEISNLIHETVSDNSSELTRDHLLINFMYYICTADNVSDCGDGLTPLEKSLAALHSLKPLCTDNLTRLVNTVITLIKQQAVMVCCRQKKLTMARQVYDRVWTSDDSNGTDMQVKNELAAILDNADVDLGGDSHYRTMLSKCHKLVECICRRFSPSYITSLAEQQPETASQNPAAAGVTAANVLSTRYESSLRPTNIVLDGAEALWVASALTDSSLSLDDSRGLSLLNETEYESLLRCLSCWQREYRYQTCDVADPQVSQSPAAAAATDNDEDDKEEEDDHVEDAAADGDDNDGEDDDVEDADPGTVSSSSRNDSVVRRLRSNCDRPLSVSPSAWSIGRKKRSLWTDAEEQKVYKAVRKYGVGNWAAVVRECGLASAGRTNVNVKDKWRTMKNQGRLRELRAKFGPIPARRSRPHNLPP